MPDLFRLALTLFLVGLAWKIGKVVFRIALGLGLLYLALSFLGFV